MYVERTTNGRERYHDPYDYINRMMAGNGLPGDWKDSGDWQARDWDRLGGILSEYSRRMRAQQPYGGGGVGPWMGGPVAQGMPWMPGGPDGGGSMPAVAMVMNPFLKIPREHHRSNRRSSWEDEIMQRMKRMESMAKEYEERMTSINNQLYGSDAERQEELYKHRQNKLWQEFQQAQMQGANGMGAVGHGLGGAAMGGLGMGMGVTQGNPMMAGPAMGMGAASMFSGGGGMGGMGMPGFGAGMGQMGGLGTMGGMGAAGMMDPMQAQMMGGTGGMGGLGNGGGMGRRGGRRARKNISFGGDDDDDDDDWDGGGRFGRSRGRRRRSRFDDDEDLFGGRFGDGE